VIRRRRPATSGTRGGEQNPTGPEATHHSEAARQKFHLYRGEDNSRQKARVLSRNVGYNDREAGFIPLVYHTKRLAFAAGLRQCATDIIRFSHGASSSRKVYRSSFIPGLHDVCMVFDKSTIEKGESL
jgi:hypothetical protein